MASIRLPFTGRLCGNEFAPKIIPYGNGNYRLDFTIAIPRNDSAHSWDKIVVKMLDGANSKYTSAFMAELFQKNGSNFIFKEDCIGKEVQLEVVLQSDVSVGAKNLLNKTEFICQYARFLQNEENLPDFLCSKKISTQTNTPSKIEIEPNKSPQNIVKEQPSKIVAEMIDETCGVPIDDSTIIKPNDLFIGFKEYILSTSSGCKKDIPPTNVVNPIYASKDSFRSFFAIN